MPLLYTVVVDAAYAGVNVASQRASAVGMILMLFMTFSFP